MTSIREALGLKPNLDAEVLLSHTLNKNRAYLFAHPEQLLSVEQVKQFTQLMTQRAQGAPIAYLTGEREFWSLNLKVTPHTLIPRHETERLVELALEFLPATDPLKILELGTGSGAIALALAKERPHWHISACDISKEALEIAQLNAQRLKLSNVTFHLSDWFNAIPQKQYHALIANPPYIAEQDPHLHQGDLPFEPVTALVSSQEGLADLQYIIKQGYNYLLPKGLLLLEHGYDQKLQVRAILNELKYQKVQCWQDLQGQDRVSGGWR